MDSKDQQKNITPERYPNVRICSRHFVSGSPARLFDQVNPDWVPTLRLGYCTEEQLERTSSTSELKVGKKKKPL